MVLQDGNAMSTNNRRYWFRAKRYGWGWGLPRMAGMGGFSSWLLIVPLGVRFLITDSKPMRWAFCVAMVIVLLAICYQGRTGGKTLEQSEGN